MDSLESPFLTDTYDIAQQLIWDFQNSLCICSVGVVKEVTEKSVTLQPLVKYFDKNNGYKDFPKLLKIPVSQLTVISGGLKIPVIVGDTGVIIWFDRDVTDGLKAKVSTKPMSGNLNNSQACFFLPFLSASAEKIPTAEEGVTLFSKSKLAINSDKDMSATSKTKLDVKSTQDMTIISEAKMTATSTADMALTSQAKLTATSTGEMNLTSKAALKTTSTAKTTLTGTAGMDLTGAGISLPDTLKQLATDASTFANQLVAAQSAAPPPVIPYATAVTTAATAFGTAMQAAIVKLTTFKG